MFFVVVVDLFFGGGCRQGDQIGRNFTIWVIFYGIGQFFSRKNSPMICAKF
jgi:hypothetical protein